MIRLPASLERKLAEQFPLIRERERFAAEAVEHAFETTSPDQKEQPVAIGGTLHLFTDGGSRGNPGQAAIGCIIEDPLRGTVLKEYAEVIGVATNNVAEYRALIKGLDLASLYHPNRLICYLDSELIVKQLNGEYRVRMPSLQVFVEEIRAITETLPDVVFTFVPREDNYRADALVNKALDAHPSPSYKKPQRRAR
ncbi:hypothetical protein A3H22_02620 [Candidatus Peribacteria bacterium RIFCSPLOWO2_12_FULL_55_15]|nr:MAG: hypothetical protein A2789_04005 [Candidatus Peribacteria bacterium RIFCSPHIGHO2_01_FULL_54_22]OGJ63242.1 MAG: hypothetical protein A3D12_02830 [Candidatus Peribacteria bacterium RIFCSPHIGHO2_02_FULL_55_24]OGJ65118.1 MAG: hypothetical protein A3E47_02195 [Candidatus Peribacteria bacterium RIFCSPHIGHO2_12_FULL_54_10]OGJ70042.1 MAG: hypothetical protein A3H90_03785 [Candidatus Peribacteria bacterium RIFCSPLOWO2_02_FULL_55_36]OGJ70553.1 MAG: hypothetical protein A3H22_02620 [Candidatus Per